MEIYFTQVVEELSRTIAKLGHYVNNLLLCNSVQPPHILYLAPTLGERAELHFL